MDVMRHFVNLSQLNYSVDNGFYHGLLHHGNPKINERRLRPRGFARIHPDQPADTVQGALNYARVRASICASSPA